MKLRYVVSEHCVRLKVGLMLIHSGTPSKIKFPVIAR